MIRFARTILVRPLLGLTALALFAVAGCGGGDNSVTPPILTSPTRQASTLELAVTLPKSTFARGEAIPYTMTVKNVSAQTLPVDYNVPAVFPIVKQNGTTIFTAVSGVSSPRTGSLSLGQVLTLTGTWDQTDLNGAQVTAGTYTFQSWLDASSVTGVVVGGAQTALNTLYTNPVSFIVR